jgi:hypothetical protein
MTVRFFLVTDEYYPDCDLHDAVHFADNALLVCWNEGNDVSWPAIDEGEGLWDMEVTSVRPLDPDNHVT